ncbi:MAG: hypothetical protein F6K58_31015 [Symploca sp. SIO2E9]|nr:hypothetical protein [Symploca sp. SIO2E9]
MNKQSAIARKSLPEEIDSFIKAELQSSPTPEESISDEQQAARVQLRLWKGKLNQIDSVLNKRKVKVSRHTWLLEAIEEKLERECVD